MSLDIGDSSVLSILRHADRLSSLRRGHAEFVALVLSHGTGAHISVKIGVGLLHERVAAMAGHCVVDVLGLHLFSYRIGARVSVRIAVGLLHEGVFVMAGLIDVRYHQNGRSDPCCPWQGNRYKAQQSQHKTSFRL